MLNIHPILVHFPIGLLTVYSLLEIISIKKLRALPFWFQVKAVMLITGVIGSWAAFASGSLIEDEFNSNLLEVHSSFAVATVVVYIIMAASYSVIWLEPWLTPRLTATWMKKIWQWKIIAARFIQKRAVICLLAVIGLVVLTITGALGGAIVYGPDIDPVVSFIYYIFFPKH